MGMLPPLPPPADASSCRCTRRLHSAAGTAGAARGNFTRSADVLQAPAVKPPRPNVCCRSNCLVPVHPANVWGEIVPEQSQQQRVRQPNSCVPALPPRFHRRSFLTRPLVNGTDEQVPPSRTHGGGVTEWQWLGPSGWVVTGPEGARFPGCKGSPASSEVRT